MGLVSVKASLMVVLYHWSGTLSSGGIFRGGEAVQQGLAQLGAGAGVLHPAQEVAGGAQPLAVWECFRGNPKEGGPQLGAVAEVFRSER